MKLAQKEKDKEVKKVISLPRGGIVINTKIGPIQVGMPPETIKDSMALGIQVPTYLYSIKEMGKRERNRKAKKKTKYQK